WKATTAAAACSPSSDLPSRRAARNAVPVDGTARLACFLASVSVPRKVLLPVLLPADVSPWGTGAWDALACARPAARAHDSRSARPDAGAGKSVDLEPDVPEPDASWLPGARQALKACLPAGRGARAPYTPDAVRFAERSSVAEARSPAAVHSGLP